ncbi:rho guanine nucleotide exchange factor 19 isoform X2 [Mugil cephalus]|uniref:rho guanine nucleotide exchange factor 19 isoform X2 n=1 Tax=Mugil cephalus TaxID=48193 RepID=UPI001FB7F040|nr:rho guanine nucleotide exchange factor 19 isoform X2 [Mugil cephalus]
MAQSDCREEDGGCLRSSVAADPHSRLGSAHLMNHLTSQMQTVEMEVCSGFPSEYAGGLDQSTDSLNQLDECSPLLDISSALRSVALKSTWDLTKILSPVPKLFSSLREENSNLSDDEGHKGEADSAEEEMLSVSFNFQSKYIHIFPLYQDYCLQAVKDDLLRLKESFVSELITPHNLHSLQSHLNASGLFETTSPPFSLPEADLPSPPPQPIRVTPCTLWQDLDEVKESGILSSLTTREIRLQETMFELIGSEASYLRSLGVAVNHFYASKALRRTLPQMEHHILFSNIRHVMAASERFLMDLEVRLGESVFISQEALVNQQMQQNRDFLCSLKKLESDPMCQRQTLKSFLVLPFQRITRIKLLLESILKLTEPDSESVSNLNKAIEAVHEIVTDCNKGVQKMKQIEELVCLEMLLDFTKVKSVPVVVSGRFLVHQGPMKQLTVQSTHNSRMSFISVYFHLFNDLLIISSKKDQRFIVLDHAEFPAHVTVEHLKTEILGLPPDSFLLHLSESQTGHSTAMILVAHTRSDKDAWVKVLSSKQ